MICHMCITNPNHEVQENQTENKDETQAENITTMESWQNGKVKNNGAVQSGRLWTKEVLGGER